MNKSIRREKGKLYVLFADMKGEFDRLKREEIWNMLEEIGTEENITERIRDIYTGTKNTNKDKDKGKNSRINGTEKRNQTRNPLSPILFNVSLADLEKEMKKVQEGGVVLERKKIYSYADNVALMFTTSEGLKEMIKRLGKYLEKKAWN